MKDKRGGDACRDGKDCAPQPVRPNAKGNTQQGSAQSDFGKDQSHRLTAVFMPVQGTVPVASLWRLPRTRSAGIVNGPKINAM
jgi:hypothetical protein